MSQVSRSSVRPAVRVCLRRGEVAAERAKLDLDPETGSAIARPPRAAAAFIISNGEIDDLARDETRFVDRGTKNPTKSLGRLLLGYRRVPLIRGTYTSAGQLLRSVRTLIERAEEADENQVYVIGADPELFEEVWERAPEPAATPAEGSGASGGGRGPRAPRAGGGTDDAGTGGSGTAGPALLELLPPVAVPRYVRERFLGESSEVELVRQLVCRAARLAEPVLILGDTGTGKELVARLVHDLSERRLQAFIPVNCGAIPRELFESELFGYERGAHSTATGRKHGLWRLAHGGTLFLDEIGDLSPDHQVKILRALEDGEIRPLGAEKHIHVDARVVAATNRDLFTMVRDGSFREDLYYRLRSFLIRTPSLREQPESIPRLAEHFWQRLVHDETCHLPAAVVDELRSFRWPGNARELRTFLSTLHGLFGKDGLRVEHVRAVLAFEGQARADGSEVEPEAGSHRVECLQHLRRADEVLRAWRVAMRPVLDAGAGGSGRREGSADIGEAVARARSRLEELDVLLGRPLLFGAETTFSAVERLAGELAACQTLLLEQAPAARKRWEDDLAADYRLVTGILFREADRLAAAR